MVLSRDVRARMCVCVCERVCMCKEVVSKDYFLRLPPFVFYLLLF